MIGGSMLKIDQYIVDNYRSQEGYDFCLIGWSVCPSVRRITLKNKNGLDIEMIRITIRI